MQDRDQHKIISNELAAILGGVLLLLPVIYWAFQIGSIIAPNGFFGSIFASIPKNWWIVNLIATTAGWQINRLSVFIDRYGEMEGLIINKLEMNFSVFLLLVQIIVFLGNHLL